MGIICCREINAINPFSKKLIYLSEIPQTKLCRIKIFDVEEEKCYEEKVILRIISSLEGISQINMNNCLYLCGTHDAANSVGSYLLKIDIAITPLQPMVLINSIFNHESPSLINYKEDLFVIGGKNQIQCEYYQIDNAKWKQLPSLPDERYKGTLFSDEQYDNIYLFGGMCKGVNVKTILKLNMTICKSWDVIIVKENENFLARNCSVAFRFDKTDNIYICGGTDNNDNNTEYIVEYNINKKKVKKFELSMRKICDFEVNGFVDLNKIHFAFFDRDNCVHTISIKGFKMSVIKFDDFCPNNSIP